MVSLSDMKIEDSVPAGALWGLASAMLYAFYLVLVRRKVNHEDRMDIPMFFGECCHLINSASQVAERILHWSTS